MVHQLRVVTDKAETYKPTVCTSPGWLKECLPTIGMRPKRLPLAHLRTSLQSTLTEWTLPHAEFFLNYDQEGKLLPAEWMRYVSVADGPDRSMLNAGYHRSFARVATTPTATVPSAIVAIVAKNLVSPMAPTAVLGVAAAAGPDPLSVLGDRAPRLGDFFTSDLFIDVDLRKQRYLLQVNATVVATEDTT